LWVFVEYRAREGRNEVVDAVSEDEETDSEYDFATDEDDTGGIFSLGGNRMDNGGGGGVVLVMFVPVRNGCGVRVVRSVVYDNSNNGP
jgi:hypothetical protein